MLTIHQKLTSAVEKHKSGDLQGAETLYRDVVRIDSAHADALHLLGVTSHQQKHHQAAVDFIERAIRVNPSSAAYHCNLGVAYRGMGRLNDAMRCFREAIRLSPDYAGAHYNLAMALVTQGNLDQAAECYQQAIRINPRFVDAFNNLGNLYASRGETIEAIDCYREAVKIDPECASAHYNLGNALNASGEHEEALVSLRRSVEINPNVPEVYNNLGIILKEQCRYEEAEKALNKAISLNADYAEAYSNLGSVMQFKGDCDAAVKCFQAAIRISPDNLDLYYNLASAFQIQTRFPEAIENFQQVLRLNPDHPEAHTNLGTLYEMAGHLSLAEMHFEKALELKPAPQRRLQLMLMMMPLYDSLPEMFAARSLLHERVDTLLNEGFSVDPAEKATSTCFYLAYHGCDDRAFLEKLNRLYISSHVSQCGVSGKTSHVDGRIHVGFASRFFRNHTIGRLMRGLIAELSREDFHVTVLSDESKTDDIANGIRAQADTCIDLPQNVPFALKNIVEQNLDVLFYPDLGMDPVTYSLAHSRLAPVQCVTWGHPITTGMKTMDYFLSSRLVETENAQRFYTERLALLDTFPTYYYRPQLDAACKARNDFGLPEEGGIYLCPQSLFKIHPEFDAILSEILKRDPNGYIVFINSDYPYWMQLMKQRFQKTIPDAHQRILFLPRQTCQDYLQLLQQADVMLDPIHFGGGNTNYEAMALGIPVVTLPSQFLRGRAAYGMYKKIGVPDCVTGSFSEYVDLSVSLVTDPHRREDIRRRILESNQSLFEEEEAVRQIETFLKEAVAVSRRA